MIVNVGLQHKLNIKPQDQYIKYLEGVNTKLYNLFYSNTYKIPGIATGALVKSLDNKLAYTASNVGNIIYLLGINNYYINLKEYSVYNTNKLDPGCPNDFLKFTGDSIISNLKYLNINGVAKSITFKSPFIYPNLKYINASKCTGLTIRNNVCPNLEYVYIPSATGVILDGVNNLKELYMPNVKSLSVKNLIDLNWIYIGENYSTNGSDIFRGSTVKEAVYINIDRATFISKYNLTNILRNSNITESQVIFKDDPGFKIPEPTIIDTPTQHIIQPLYNYNYNYNYNDNKFFYDVCQNSTTISNDSLIYLRALAFYINTFSRSHLVFNNVESIGDQITVDAQWSASFKFPKLKTMGYNVINTTGGTIDLSELETFNGYIAVHTINSSSSNLVIELPKLKKVTGVEAGSLYAFIRTNNPNVLIKKVFLDSLEYWNYKFHLLKVAANAVYIGPNIKDINEYLHMDSYNSSRTTNIYIDVPRATLETFSGYSKNFGSSTATTINIICNDDPDWKSAEELRAED